MTDHQIIKPMTQQDRHMAFMQAVHSTSGAKIRWQNHAKNGLNNADLHKALRDELGIFGGRSGPDMISIVYQGSGLKIWAAWGGVNHCTAEPIFQGNQTMVYAREAFNIPSPDNMQMSLF